MWVHTFISEIAEELRGLAVETNVPIVSATQTTRSGFVSSDIGWKIRQKVWCFSKTHVCTYFYRGT